MLEIPPQAGERGTKGGEVIKKSPANASGVRCKSTGSSQRNSTCRFAAFFHPDFNPPYGGRTVGTGISPVQSIWTRGLLPPIEEFHLTPKASIIYEALHKKQEKNRCAGL